MSTKSLSYSKTFRSLFFIFISILISFILYGKSINGAFVYDDFNWAGRDDLRNGTSFLKLWGEPYIPDLNENGTYRPLTIFSFAVNFSLFGDSTVSFHLINIIINGLVIFLAYKLILTLFQDEALAIITAIFFAFMPIHSEAVAFIKSRDELLRSLFILISFILFIKATTDCTAIRWKLIISSLVLYFLALLAKESIVIAPIQYAALLWIRKDYPKKLIFKVILPFVLITSIYLMIRFLVLGPFAFGYDNLTFVLNPIRQVSLLPRIWTTFAITFLYISKTFIPWNLSATYHYKHLEPYYNPFQSITIFLGILYLTALICLVIYKKTRNTPLGIGALITVTSYAIISKFFLTAGEIMAERMFYYPSLGLAMIAGFFFTQIYRKKKTAGIILLSGVLLIYSVITINRNTIWLSKRNLGESMVRDAPKSIMGHFMLATVEFNERNYEKAKEHAQKAYAINKTMPSLLHLMGRLAIAEGRYDLAEKLLKKSLSQSNYREVSKYLAYALAKQGKYEESLKLLLPYINNDDSQIKLLAGTIYLKLGKEEVAKKYLKWNDDLQQFEEQKILDGF